MPSFRIHGRSDNGLKHRGGKEGGIYSRNNVLIDIREEYVRWKSCGEYVWGGICPEGKSPFLPVADCNVFTYNLSGLFTVWSLHAIVSVMGHL